MLGELTIVGVFVSVIVQILKKKYETQKLTTTGIVIALSLLGGLLYWFLNGTEIWTSFLEILATASTIYALIFNQLSAKTGI